MRNYYELFYGTSTGRLNPPSSDVVLYAVGKDINDLNDEVRNRQGLINKYVGNAGYLVTWTSVDPQKRYVKLKKRSFINLLNAMSDPSGYGTGSFGPGTRLYELFQRTPGGTLAQSFRDQWIREKSPRKHGIHG